MKIQTSKGISHSVSPVNEDVFNIVENAAWVIDGATGLTNKRITDFKSDAQWYASRWNSYLTENINSNSDINEIIKEGITFIKKEYEGFKGFDKLSELDYPCAAIALIRIKNNKIEYYVLGDSSLVYKCDGGNTSEIYDKHLEELEVSILNKIKAVKREKNINMLEAKAYCLEEIKNTRMLKNTNEGYWILELDEQAADHAICGSIDAQNNIKVFMTSDGFSQYYDTINIAENCEEFLDLAEANDMNTLCEKLRLEQDKDSLCNKYPRLKKSDDATLVYLEIG